MRPLNHDYLKRLVSDTSLYNETPLYNDKGRKYGEAFSFNFFWDKTFQVVGNFSLFKYTKTLCKPYIAGSVVAVLLLLAIVLFVGFKYNKLKDIKEDQYEHDEAVTSIGYLIIK